MRIVGPIVFTDQVWHPNPTRWGSVAHYQAACLFNNDLPIQEPDGRYNVLAMLLAARVLPDVAGTPMDKRTAARQLMRLLFLAHRPVPPRLCALAEGSVS